MGSLVKCSGCGKRCDAKPIGTYWRWMRADGVWKHYYARLCTGCWAAKVAPLDVDYAPDSPLTCPSCGMQTEDDYDGVYTTSFPGKGPQMDTESPFCDTCVIDVKNWVLEHARDTDINDGAPGPHRESASLRPSAQETLRALGR